VNGLFGIRNVRTADGNLDFFRAITATADIPSAPLMPWLTPDTDAVVTSQRSASSRGQHVPSNKFHVTDKVSDKSTVWMLVNLLRVPTLQLTPRLITTAMRDIIAIASSWSCVTIPHRSRQRSGMFTNSNWVRSRNFLSAPLAAHPATAAAFFGQAAGQGDALLLPA
jgi:hypothetical protein